MSAVKNINQHCHCISTGGRKGLLICMQWARCSVLDFTLTRIFTCFNLYFYRSQRILPCVCSLPLRIRLRPKVARNWGALGGWSTLLGVYVWVWHQCDITQGCLYELSVRCTEFMRSVSTGDKSETKKKEPKVELLLSRKCHWQVKNTDIKTIPNIRHQYMELAEWKHAAYRFGNSESEVWLQL